MTTAEDPTQAETAAAPVTENTPIRDDELVYVDPDTNSVVGRMEWSKTGNPKSRAYEITAPVPGEKERRSRFRKFYPFGTYKSMKRVFHVEGKRKKEQPEKTLDDILPKALKEPFWD